MINSNVSANQDQNSGSLRKSSKEYQSLHALTKTTV